MKFSTSKLALLGAAAVAGISTSDVSAFVAPSSSSTATRSKSRSLFAKKRGEGYGPPLENISETIGNTPMVKISDRISPAGR